MSIMSYTGGTILAMAGNDCVCIASDLRLGEQMTTVATNMKKVIFPTFTKSPLGSYFWSLEGKSRRFYGSVDPSMWISFFLTKFNSLTLQVHKLGEKVYIGLGGFHSDAKTVLDKITFRKNLYELRENRKIKPEVSIDQRH